MLRALTVWFLLMAFSIGLRFFVIWFVAGWAIYRLIGENTR
jgi:hypothetical protein